MTKLEIGGSNGWHPEEIGVFGVTFHTRRVSRSVNRQVNEANEKIREATNDDEAFDALVTLIDAILEPASGRRKKAGSLLREKWEADELFMDQLDAFAQQVQEAAMQQVPPTPTPS